MPACEVKAVKDQVSRGREAEMIREQLDHLGFPEEMQGGLRTAFADFVDNGVGCTRRFKFRALGVEVVLLLSLQPRVTSYARVRALGGGVRRGRV